MPPSTRILIGQGFERFAVRETSGTLSPPWPCHFPRFSASFSDSVSLMSFKNVDKSFSCEVYLAAVSAWIGLELRNGYDFQETRAPSWAEHTRDAILLWRVMRIVKSHQKDLWWIGERSNPLRDAACVATRQHSIGTASNILSRPCCTGWDVPAGMASKPSA